MSAQASTSSARLIAACMSAASGPLGSTSCAAPRITGASSAASAIWPIARTASTGFAPTLVSADSITADVPSMTALATSAASARVGSAEDTIDSSMWVAVMTSLPACVERTIVSFCMSGTRATPASTP